MPTAVVESRSEPESSINGSRVFAAEALAKQTGSCSHSAGRSVLTHSAAEPSRPSKRRTTSHTPTSTSFAAAYISIRTQFNLILNIFIFIPVHVPEVNIGPILPLI